jgi:hypothetical protein
MMVLQFLSRFAAAVKNAIPKSRPQHTAAVSNNNKKNTLYNEKIKTTFYLFCNLSLDLIARIQCAGAL